MPTSEQAAIKRGQVWRSIKWAEPREATVTAVRQGTVYFQQGIKWRATEASFRERFELVG